MRGIDERPRVALWVFDDFYLHLDQVREILGSLDETSGIESVNLDGEHKSVSFKFHGSAEWGPRETEPPNLSAAELGRRIRLRDQWKEPAFMFATEWLRSKNPEQFKRLREGGMEAAILVEQYAGQLPKEFLDQVVRHRLELHFV